MSDQKKFLDAKGVEYLWSKISMEDYPNNETLVAILNAIDETKADKYHAHDDIYYTETEIDTKLEEKSNIIHYHNYYGVCSTPAATVEKTVEIDNFELVVGAMIIVKFDNSNSASNPTLNVSGTGAKPMYRYGTTAMSTSSTTTGWSADAIQIFVYDGNGWIRDYWNNSTYSNASLGNGYGTCSTAASTKAKTASLSSYTLSTGGCVSIKFTNSVPAGATLNVNSKGAKAMYYRGAAITDNIVKAGDIATFVYSGTYYHLIAIDRWQEDPKNMLNEAKTYTDEKVANLVNSAPETLDTLGELATAFQENDEVVDALNEAITNKKDKDLIVTYAEGSTFGVTHSTQEIYNVVQDGASVYFQKGTELFNLMEITPDYATFFMFYINMEGKPQQKVIVINDSSIMLDQDDTYDYATATQLNSYYNKTEVDNLLSSVGSSDDMLLKTEQTLTDEELAQVRSNLKFIGQDVAGKTFTINGKNIVASPNAEIFGDYVNNKCTGQWSIVEGSTNIATGRACHVEGAQNQALNDGCHVEGVNCIASGYWSHAEGEYTRVTSYASHAEGSYTKMPDGTTRYGTASGYASHIEGGGCYAQGSCSHSEGLATTTKGNYSHSEGRHTIAGSPAQHVEGTANIEDTESKYIHIAGNGDWDARSNAHTLDWNGNAWFGGDVYVGSTSGTNRDEGSKKLATVEEMNAAIALAIGAAIEGSY